MGQGDTVTGDKAKWRTRAEEGSAQGPYGFSLQCLQSAEGVPEKAAHLSGQGSAAPAEKGYTAAWLKCVKGAAATGAARPWPWLR